MRDWLFLTEEAQHVVASRTSRLWMRDVLLAVAEESGHSVDELRGKSKRGTIPHARQIAMLLMRECCDRSSLPAIGRFLSDRDHSTVYDGIRAARMKIATRAPFRELYERSGAKLREMAEARK